MDIYTVTKNDTVLSLRSTYGPCGLDIIEAGLLLELQGGKAVPMTINSDEVQARREGFIRYFSETPKTTWNDLEAQAEEVHEELKAKYGDA